MKAMLQSRPRSPHMNEDLYAAPGDFCGIFKENIMGLYSLSLLLTADHAKAEQCFVGGFEDSVHSNRVFKQWAHSWSRRNIVKRAIRMIQPSPQEVISTPQALQGA